MLPETLPLATQHSALHHADGCLDGGKLTFSMIDLYCSLAHQPPCNKPGFSQIGLAYPL